MQALRTNPRHLVRFMALRWNTWRNRVSSIAASQSMLGQYKEHSEESDVDGCSLAEDCRLGSGNLVLSVRGKVLGWNCSDVEIGARRFQGQTSWQMSQPNRWLPMGSRSS